MIKILLKDGNECEVKKVSESDKMGTLGFLGLVMNVNTRRRSFAVCHVDSDDIEIFCKDEYYINQWTCSKMKTVGDIFKIFPDVRMYKFESFIKLMEWANEDEPLCEN